MDYQESPSAVPAPAETCQEMQMNGQCRHRNCQYEQQMPPANGSLICHGTEIKWGQQQPQPQPPSMNFSRFCNGGGYETTIDYQERNEFQSMKRPPPQSSSSDCYDSYKRFRDSSDSIVNHQPQQPHHQSDIMTILRRFEDEHNMLRCRVEANEVKIAELRASNDYLLSQNAHLRTRVVNPVTVTTSQPQATVRKFLLHFLNEIIFSFFLLRMESVSFPVRLNNRSSMPFQLHQYKFRPHQLLVWPHRRHKL